MIPQRNLSLLSNRLTRRGGRRIPESVLERDYCLAWFLVGLSRSALVNRLAFKGGTALKRCYFGDYRFSEDLDFTLTEETSLEAIQSELVPLFDEVRRASGIAFRYAREDRHGHLNTHTFFLGFEGPLPVVSGEKEVKVDITIREKLVLPLEKRPVLRGYDEYEDLPADAEIRVYSLKEIAVEKIVALGDSARNEPRDLYDVWFLLTEGHVQADRLTAPLRNKLESRNKELTEIQLEFLKKEGRLKKLWNVRLASQMLVLPEFDDVFRAVQRHLRQAGILKN